MGVAQELALPFEFTVDGPPVSYQTRNRAGLREWRRRVRTVAERRWPAGESPANGPVMFTIIHFYDYRELDADNIPKPIIDALKELVFQDDDQVTDLVCRKRYIHNTFRVDRTSDILRENLDRRNEFVYIIVEEAPDQEVIE